MTWRREFRQETQKDSAHISTPTGCLNPLTLEKVPIM